jgi:ABC-type multidrug transport system permease subunit
VSDPDGLDRTETQQEWADWAAHGYRKLYQPRSMLWFGGIFFTLFAIGLVVLFWLAASGRLS